jgi:DNA-binding NarL/FixJ family response regulator
MPTMDGLEATRRIRKRGLQTQILILRGTEASISSEVAAEAGASGYLRKRQGIEELRGVFLEAASRSDPRPAWPFVTPRLARRRRARPQAARPPADRTIASRSQSRVAANSGFPSRN